jgi:hypothetical protein
MSKPRREQCNGPGGGGSVSAACKHADWGAEIPSPDPLVPVRDSAKGIGAEFPAMHRGVASYFMSAEPGYAVSSASGLTADIYFKLGAGSGVCAGTAS